MLEIRNLDVAYGPAKVLHDVSLDIKRGEMAFFIGRNGAGKTTLLKTIIGLLKPQKGSIVYQGQEISGLFPEALYLKGLRYVAQEKKVFGNLTVRENIEIAAMRAENLGQGIRQDHQHLSKVERLSENKGRTIEWWTKTDPLIGRLWSESLNSFSRRTHSRLAAIVIEDIVSILWLRDKVLP
jgi:ABC-type branched-subunit amino acid transport system ATPase component